MTTNQEFNCPPRCKQCGVCHRGECRTTSGEPHLDSLFEQQAETLHSSLRKKWLEEADDLLTKAGVPKWVEVEGTAGNTVPHRLMWYLCRRKDVSESERAGVCPELNKVGPTKKPQ